MGAAAEFTDANFQSEVLDAAEPVLVDFWATWCAPCRQIAPMIEELAGEYGDAAKIGKLDIDDNREAAMKYGVTNIPTLIVFKGGEPVQRFLGPQPKAKLQEAIDAAKA